MYNMHIYEAENAKEAHIYEAGNAKEDNRPDARRLRIDSCVCMNVCVGEVSCARERER